MEKLFTYGTLQDSEIQQKLFGRILKGKTDILVGYVLSNIVIDGNEYSAVTLKLGEQVQGVVYDLSLDEFKLTEKYEGNSYKIIKTRLLSGVKSWVYVLA